MSNLASGLRKFVELVPILQSGLRTTVKIDLNGATLTIASGDELGEFDGMTRKVDHANLKAFLSKTDDYLRRPYAVVEERIPRKSVFGATVMNTYSGFAKAFEMLGETGAELSPMATGYIAYFGTEATGMPNPVMMLVGVTGLLIALSPLWFNTSD